MCVTDRHDMTLAVKVALNPNTTNQLPYMVVIFHFKCTLKMSSAILYRFGPV